MMLRAMIPQTIMRLIAADRYGGFGIWTEEPALAYRPGACHSSI